MKIYLIRHAVAAERNLRKYPDDDRPLTTAGGRKMKRNVRGMKRFGFEADCLVSSPMKRALKTAEIVKNGLKLEAPVIIRKEFLPGGSIGSQLRFIKSLRPKESVMITGHEPDLSLLAARLLGCKHDSLGFKKGGLCLIEADFRTGKNKLLAWLPPALLEKI